jgi:hypothetical protein
MAYSYVEYEADGISTVFSIVFPYIETTHIYVSVDGVDVEFEFLNATIVQIEPAPAASAVVRIRRQTPKSGRLVNFSNGSVLRESALDKNANQLFYAMQEVYDSFQELLPVIDTIGSLVTYGAASLGPNEFTGNQSISGDLDMLGNTITDTVLDDVTIQNYQEGAAVNVGSSSGTINLDVADGNTFIVGPSGNVTFTFTPKGQCCSFTLVLDAGGAYTIAWPTSVQWPQGQTPELDDTEKDVLVFFTYDGGTTWIGSLAFDAVQ